MAYLHLPGVSFLILSHYFTLLAASSESKLCLGKCHLTGCEPDSVMGARGGPGGRPSQQVSLALFTRRPGPER